MLALTAAEKMSTTPVMVWVKFGAIILAVIIALIVVRKILSINRYLILVVFVVGGSILMINWAYHRTEPRFMTPIIDAIAPFLPTGKGLEPPKLDTENPSRTPAKRGS
ncbi:MAG: hypothetical protein SFV32_02575 [Opitutaceae bacterium]|nr:hypothetical protein [Opitutaceae bacterium]